MAKICRLTVETVARRRTARRNTKKPDHDLDNIGDFVCSAALLPGRRRRAEFRAREDMQDDGAVQF